MAIAVKAIPTVWRDVIAVLDQNDFLARVQRALNRSKIRGINALDQAELAVLKAVPHHL
jgi:hypothetical protein